MKQITITVPDNCELKQNGNTYTIVEKEKKVTYKDVIKGLYPHSREQVMGGYQVMGEYFNSEKHLRKLIAINKLMNVAKYLNGNWQPNWNDDNEFKYYIYYSNRFDQLSVTNICTAQSQSIYFKSEEVAQQAIEILGEEIIKLTLCTDY